MNVSSRYWSPFNANDCVFSRNEQQKVYVKGKERTVFLKSGEEKSSYSIFFLLLHSTRIMLGVNTVQFFLHQGRKVKLQHFPSRTLFGTHYVSGKQRTVVLTSGEENSTYSIFSLLLYSARIMLGVNSAQFSLHQGRKVKLQHFSLVFYSARIMLGVNTAQFSLHQGRKVKLQHFLSRILFGTHYVRGKQRTVFLT